MLDGRIANQKGATARATRSLLLFETTITGIPAFFISNNQFLALHYRQDHSKQSGYYQGQLEQL